MKTFPPPPTPHPPPKKKKKKLTSLPLLPPSPEPHHPPSPHPHPHSKKNKQATFYGHEEGQDAQGACSFSENFANTNGLPWTKGISNTIALNDAQFANGAACGMCVMYQGTGEGIGTTPLATVREGGGVGFFKS